MTLKEKAYKEIKERILSGEYAPGQLLNEKKIIEELGISRTPFREAVNALNKEGLVNIRPNKGMFVREFSFKEMLEIFDVRYIIEPNIVKLACGRISLEVLENLKERNERALHSDAKSMRTEDEYFHSEILKYVDNSLLKRIMENVYECDWVRVMHNYMPRNLESSIREHLAIIECLIKNEPENATEATKAHLAEARKRAIGLVF